MICTGVICRVYGHGKAVSPPCGNICCLSTFYNGIKMLEKEIKEPYGGTDLFTVASVDFNAQVKPLFAYGVHRHILLYEIGSPLPPEWRLRCSPNLHGNAQR